jgi:hypothetical protein
MKPSPPTPSPSPRGSSVIEPYLQRPLLGNSRKVVLAALPRLAAIAASQPDPELEAGLLRLGAELALQDGRPDAARQLAEAARAARQAGQTAADLELRLRALRALCRAGKVAQARDQLERLCPSAPRFPAAEAEWQLVAARCGATEAKRALLRALELLPSPARDHDRLDVLLSLADLHVEGGDLARSKAALDGAAQLAAAHDDPVAACHVEALRGNLLLEAGLQGEAETALRAAVVAADSLGDDLTVIAQGTLLIALLQAQEDHAQIEPLARQVLRAAERRHNWLAVADATIAWAGTLVAREAWSAAVAILLRTARVLRGRGSEAGVNLIKARLAELRNIVGAEDFDPLMGEVAGRV